MEFGVVHAVHWIMVEIYGLETKIIPWKHRILNCLRERIYDSFFLLMMKRVNDRDTDGKQYISVFVTIGWDAPN